MRLIDHNGNMIGVLPFMDALKKAELVGMDLVEISPNVSPPVCKILDFGKYKYEMKKKNNDAKKKQKVVSLKEVKFRLNIGNNDFEVKIRNIVKFLEDGDKVKVSLQFKGREITHNDLGMKVFERIIEAMGESAKIETEPRMEGKQIMMIVSPAVKK